MVPKLQDTCLAYLRQNDLELSEMNCEQMEAKVTEMVEYVEGLLKPIRVTSSDSALEPPDYNQCM